MHTLPLFPPVPEIAHVGAFWHWRITVAGLAVRMCDHPLPSFDEALRELRYHLGLIDRAHQTTKSNDWHRVDIGTGELVKEQP